MACIVFNNFTTNDTYACCPSSSDGACSQSRFNTDTPAIAYSYFYSRAQPFTNGHTDSLSYSYTCSNTIANPNLITYSNSNKLARRELSKSWCLLSLYLALTTTVHSFGFTSLVCLK